MSSLGRVALVCGVLLATSAQASIHHRTTRALLRGHLANHVELQHVGPALNKLMVRHLVFAAYAHRLARVGIDVLPLWENNNRHLLAEHQHLLAEHRHHDHHDSMISPLHPNHPLISDGMISPLHPNR